MTNESMDPAAWAKQDFYRTAFHNLSLTLRLEIGAYVRLQYNCPELNAPRTGIYSTLNPF